MLGQLLERVTPDLLFDKVDVDYAGPFYIKYGHVRKPTVVKTYASVFVSLSVKAVHLELVSELTTEAFLAWHRWLHRWHLCQAFVHHFWQRWSSEYITSLKRYTKWYHPSRNICVGDIVILQEDNLIPTKWPLARVFKVHAGKDDLVQVVTVKTSSGTYMRPISKIALLLSSQDD